MADADAGGTWRVADQPDVPVPKRPEPMDWLTLVPDEQRTELIKRIGATGTRSEQLTTRRELYRAYTNSSESNLSKFLSAKPADQRQQIDSFNAMLESEHPNLGQFMVRPGFEQDYETYAGLGETITATRKVPPKYAPLFDDKLEYLYDSVDKGLVAADELDESTLILLSGIMAQRESKSGGRSAVVSRLQSIAKEKGIGPALAKVGGLTRGALKPFADIATWGAEKVGTDTSKREYIHSLAKAAYPESADFEQWGNILGLLGGSVAVYSKLAKHGLTSVVKQGSKRKFKKEGLAAMAATEFGLGYGYNTPTLILHSGATTDEYGNQKSRILSGLEAMLIGSAFGLTVDAIAPLKNATVEEAVKILDNGIPRNSSMRPQFDRVLDDLSRPIDDILDEYTSAGLPSGPAGTFARATGQDGPAGVPTQRRQPETDNTQFSERVPVPDDSIDDTLGVYTPITNKDTHEKARLRLSGMSNDEAIAYIKDMKNPTPVEMAMGMQVMRQIEDSANPNWDTWISVRNSVAEKAKDAGQVIQILASYNRLTPAGALEVAQRELAGASRREVQETILASGNENAKQFLSTIGQRIKQLQKEGVDHTETAGAIDRALDRLIKNKKTKSGLWARYKDSVANTVLNKLKGGSGGSNLTPPMQELAERLEKQLLSRMTLPARQAALRNPEKKLLGQIADTIKNPDKYKQVIQKVRSKVQDEIKAIEDGGQAGEASALQSTLVELDEILYNLQRGPVSDESMRELVKSSLRGEGVDLSKLVREHYEVPSGIAQNLDQKLVLQAGFSPAEAKIFSDEWTKVFNQVIDDKKVAELLKVNERQLNASNRVLVQKGFITKAQEMLNLGAFDDVNFHSTALRFLGEKVPKTGQLTTQQISKIKKAADKVRQAKSMGNEAYQARAGLELSDAIHAVGRTRADDVLSTVSATMMLLDPITLGKNVLGNLTMPYMLGGRETFASMADRTIGLFTGTRTLTFNPSKFVTEYLKGGWGANKDFIDLHKKLQATGLGKREAASEVYETMVSLGRLTAMNKMEAGDLSTLSSVASRTFHNKKNPLYHLENALSIGLGIPDRMFYNARYRQAVGSIMRAKNETQPSQATMETAHKEALTAIYQSENVAVGAIRGLKRAVNLNKNYGLGDSFLRFVRVPTNLAITGLLKYSPVRFATTIQKAGELILHKVGGRMSEKLRSTPWDTQRDLVTSLGEGLTGSGMIASGYWLFDRGVVTGGDAIDGDLRDYEREHGKDSYQLNVSALYRQMAKGFSGEPEKNQENDLMVGFGWAMPGALPIISGVNMRDWESKQRLLEKKSAATPWSSTGHYYTWLQGAKGAFKALEDQPFMQGIKNFSNSVSFVRESESPMLEVAKESALLLPQQFTPSVLKKVGRVIDGEKREVRHHNSVISTYNKIVSGLPFLSKSLPLRYTADGEVEQWYQGDNSILNVFANPAMKTRFKSDPVLRKVVNLYEKTGQTKQVPQARVKLKQDFLGVKIPLNSEQISLHERVLGTTTRRLMQYVIYPVDKMQDLPPEDRAKVMRAKQIFLEPDAKIENKTGRLSQERMLEVLNFEGLQAHQQVDVFSKIIKSADELSKVMLYGNHPDVIKSLRQDAKKYNESARLLQEGDTSQVHDMELILRRLKSQGGSKNIRLLTTPVLDTPAVIDASEIYNVIFETRHGPSKSN